MAPRRFDLAGADGLRAEDRGGDGDRDGRELHVGHHLVHRAVGRGGLRAVGVDEGEQGELGQRDHDHLHAGRHADLQHRLQQRRPHAQVPHEAGIGRQRALLAPQVKAQPRGRDHEGDHRGPGAAGHAHLRQAEPAADQRRRDHQAEHGRDDQRVERRHRVAHAAQHRGGEQEHEEARHRDQDDACVGAWRRPGCPAACPARPASAA